MSHSLSVVAVVLVAVVLFGTVAQAEFPERKSIEIIVPFSAGGGSDTIARAISLSMTKYLPKGVKTIVRNVPGAGGGIGTTKLYRAKPDGYTIGQLNGGTLATIFRRATKAKFDFEKLTWLAQVGEVGYALLLRKDSKFKTLKDLQQAKRITWGIQSGSVGRWIHAVITAHELGIPFEVVSGYRGSGETLAGFLRGDYDVFLHPIHHRSVVRYLKNGEIRPLLNLAPVRPAYAPKVPTAKDAGYNFTLISSRYIAAPPATPAKRAKFLEKALHDALNDKAYNDFIKKSSGIVIGAGDANRAKEDVAYRVALLRKYIGPILNPKCPPNCPP